jgi:hypothetical protein
MDEKQKERWRKLRARGKRHYILVHGIGISMLCVIVATFVVRSFRVLALGDSHNVYFENLDIPAILVISFSLIGAYRARKEWKANETEYVADEQPNGSPDGS